MAALVFIEALIEGAAAILKSQQNKTAQEVGNDIQAIDAVTLAVLRKNAEVKGLTIDWSDPTAVMQYVGTLPTFMPISDPAALPAAKPDPTGTAPKS